MSNKEKLVDALTKYNIKIEQDYGTKIMAQNHFEIEIEANGLYKLYDDGYVVAPFDNLDELCKFILQS